MIRSGPDESKGRPGPEPIMSEYAYDDGSWDSGDHDGTGDDITTPLTSCVPTAILCAYVPMTQLFLRYQLGRPFSETRELKVPVRSNFVRIFPAGQDTYLLQCQVAKDHANPIYLIRGMEVKLIFSDGEIIDQHPVQRDVFLVQYGAFWAIIRTSEKTRGDDWTKNVTQEHGMIDLSHYVRFPAFWPCRYQDMVVRQDPKVPDELVLPPTPDCRRDWHVVGSPYGWFAHRYLTPYKNRGNMARVSSTQPGVGSVTVLSGMQYVGYTLGHDARQISSAPAKFQHPLEVNDWNEDDQRVTDTLAVSCTRGYWDVRYKRVVAYPIWPGGYHHRSNPVPKWFNTISGRKDGSAYCIDDEDVLTYVPARTDPMVMALEDALTPDLAQYMMSFYIPSLF